MAADEQKRSIKEHLARSGNMDYERTPQNYDPSQSASRSTGEKKDIQDHLDRTKGKTDLTSSSGSEEQRKRKVMDHLDNTKG